MKSIFPPLDAKSFDRLPQVFKWIIEADENNPIHEKVVSIKDWLGWKETRAQLRRGAQNVIKKQRGSGGGASSG